MRVLITGASRGIGAGIARKLSSDAKKFGQSAKLALAASHESDQLIQLVTELQGQDVEVTALVGDLADPATPERLINEAVAFCGGLDGLISNAGIASGGPLVSVKRADWDRLFAVNVRATWLLAKAAHATLVENQGALVAIASMSGMQPHTNNGAYSMTKAALIMLCRQLAQEWAGDGVRVNSISPGMIRTSLTEKFYQDEKMAAERQRVVPMHRIGKPEDIARVAAFLLGDGANYVTGQNIAADGGFVDSIMGTMPTYPVTTG